MLDRERIYTRPELIRRYLEGDRTVSEQLLKCQDYQQQVRLIAHKYTQGTSVQWEDAVQSAHEKVFIALKNQKFQPKKGNFAPWAITVAKFAIIDLIRQENPRNHSSLDQTIPGTDCLLSDAIADDFNLLDAIERAELIFKVRQALKTLAQRYPQRKYLKLWQGKIQEKTQVQLAEELGITQGAVSKRWKELTARIAEALELLPEQLETTQLQEAKNQRTRSQSQW